jgi:hypothetical protein
LRAWLECQAALNGFDCVQCRSQCADHTRDVPCDVDPDGCPYVPSPGGDGALSPANVTAVWLHERLRTLGPVALELVDLAVTPADAELLVEQLYTLETYSAYLRSLQQQEGS